MARRHWPWDVLGIDRTADKAAIRSAYAVRLKAMDVDADIQGYSALRSARDQALRDADHMAEGQADDPLMDAEPDLLDDLDPAGEAESDPGEWVDIGQRQGGDAGLANPWDNDFGYGTGDFADPDMRVAHFEEQLSEDASDRRLARLLYPQGAYSEEAFTHEENEAAQAALTELLADAKGNDLGREQAVEHWLGEVLAESWPRSGPLVEQAAQAFDWVAQSGEIGERPALQFLNPRIRGLRFVVKVEQPDHPFHTYWEELKRPGKRGFFDRFRIKREGIENLLGGIRTRYPEVESYLDHERVASWEKPAPGWIAWILQRVFIFIVVIQLLAYCGGMLKDETLPADDQEVIAAEVFGPDVSMLDVLRLRSPLYDDFSNAFESGVGDGRTPAQIEQELVTKIRARILIAQLTASQADAVSILELKRELLRSASVSGTPGCLSVLRDALLPEGAIMTEQQRELERAMAWRLAKSKQLVAPPPERTESQQVALPNWVQTGLIERTRLSADRINAVLKGEETQDLCAVRIALIDTLLSRPDDAPLELLRIM